MLEGSEGRQRESEIAKVSWAVRGALGETGTMAVLTGAGVSAESGLATFRGTGGLWYHVRIEDVATPEAFARDPDLVLEFYNARRRQLRDVEPNPAHFALARLEKALPGRFTLITQNVDDLHERGGSTGTLHMHGELRKARCRRCARVVPWTEDVTRADRCEACGGGLRPHIVWFGEVPFYVEDRIPEATASDVFLAVGTSGNVYPAAGMVLDVRFHGGLAVEVNLEPAENTSLFHHHLIGPAGTVLPELVDRVLEGR
jgi:NAD-dependent deacetylase